MSMEEFGLDVMQVVGTPAPPHVHKWVSMEKEGGFAYVHLLDKVCNNEECMTTPGSYFCACDPCIGRIEWYYKEKHNRTGG